VSTTKASLGTLFLMLSLAAPALGQEAAPRQPVTDKTKERWAKSQGGRFGFEIDVLSSSYQREIAEAGGEEASVEESSRLGVAISIMYAADVPHAIVNAGRSHARVFLIDLFPTNG